MIITILKMIMLRLKFQRELRFSSI